MKKYWIVFLLSFLVQIGSACSCTGPDKFVDGIHNRNFTFMGEVIGHDSIPGGWYSKNKITILKVLKKYHGYGAFEIDTSKVYFERRI